MVTKGEGGDKLGVWDEQIHITIQKINNKVLLYSVGNYIQYLAITYTGKESEKYIHLNHFVIHLKVTQYCKSTILQ